MPPPAMSRDTYNDMVSTGSLGLLPVTVREAIGAYYGQAQVYADREAIFREVLTKLKPMEEQYRAKYNAPSVAEWFQWLAERLQDYRTGAATPPAYEAFKDWKPSR